MSEPIQSSQQQAARQVITEALRELTTVSDEARFQIHLFSLEAKRRWNEIEAKLRQLETRVADSDEGDAGHAEELSRAIRELLAEQNARNSPSAPVRSLMKHDVRTCQPDQSLSEAAAVMSELKCSTLPVVDSQGVLLGMLSEHDICMGAFASGAALSETPVATAMQRDVISSLPEDSLSSAAEAMRRHKLRHMPVAESNGRVVGMLCLGDLARRLDSDVEHGLDPAWVAATLVGVYAG
ncbi:MAG: CBS domain-containing protein [Polyangiaceae bacterium]